MVTQKECRLCNPDAGGDSLCPACIARAASYDLLHMQLTLAALALRRLRQTMLDDMPVLDAAGQADKGKCYIDRIDSLLAGEFADVLAEYDARKAQEAEFRRQAQAAMIHPQSVRDAQECREIDALADRMASEPKAVRP
jgi:hypothetical protein